MNSVFPACIKSHHTFAQNFKLYHKPFLSVPSSHFCFVYKLFFVHFMVPIWTEDKTAEIPQRGHFCNSVLQVENIVRRILAIWFLNWSREEDIAERLLVHSESFGRQPELASYFCKCGRPNWFAYPVEGSCKLPWALYSLSLLATVDFHS